MKMFPCRVGRLTRNMKLKETYALRVVRSDNRKLSLLQKTIFYERISLQPIDFKGFYLAIIAERDYIPHVKQCGEEIQENKTIPGYKARRLDS